MSPQMNGQGCNILNVSNNLEINTAMYPFPHPYGGRAFFTGRIKNWYSSHQSPHLITNDVNGGCTLFNIPDELTAYKCMGSSVSNNSSTTEGMFTLVNIISDPTITYDVELTCKRVSCSPEIPGSDIEVSFTNGLANSEQQNIPIPDQQIVVGLFNVDNILPEIFPFRDITINGDYSQIWVRTSPIETNSRTEILDVTLTCNTIALTGLLKTKLTSQSYLFEPEATKLFESYDWQIDGNTVSTNETLNFTFEEDGVYKICLDVVDEYGCCAQECDLVAIDSYCDVPADAIIIYDCYDGVFDGVVNLADVITPIAFAPIISNRIFYIAPYTELNVTSWFTQFNGCTFQCDEGSMIRSSSPFFSIVNSTLHGCEKMWKGVYDNDATLDNFKGNRILDAEFGINVINGNSVTITGNFFWDDYIGINFPSNEVTSTRGNVISSNEFRGVNGLLPPYNGQFPYLNTMFAGIQAFDLNTLNLVSSSSSNPNLFQDLHNGVLMSNSGLIAQNNEFTDLIGNYTDLSSLNVFRGVGIGVLSTFDKLNIRNTLIDNCHGGIFAHNIRSTNVDITENILENCNFNTFSFGIKLQNGFLSPVNISDNFSLNNNRDAIVLSNIDFSNINISNNQQMNDNKNAISVFLCNPFFSTASITSNYISNSTLNNANGITINGCDLISVKDNIIDNNTNSGLGIAIGNSFACLIHNNTVNGGREGLSVTLSSSGTYSCNSISGALRGIDVLGACINTKVKTNTLSNGPTAYDISLNNTEIGQQPRHGNIFVGNSRAFIDGNSDPQENEFSYNPNDPMPIMGGNWKPTIIKPNTVTNWFVTNFDDGNELCMNNNVQQPIQAGLENIANGVSSVSSFADQHLWSAQWQLMQLVSQDPSLLNNTYISNFYYSNADVIQYFNINKHIEELYYPTANEISSFESLKINLHQKKNELDVILSGVSESNYEANKGMIETKSQEIVSKSNQINVIKDAISQRAYNQAVSLKNAVSSLNEPSLFCADYKTTFNAALDVVIYGDATAKATYDNDLIDLAESCVLEKGISVLQAQALCETLNLIYVPHQNDCIDNRNKKEAPGLESKEILVYPVPSSNIIVLLNLVDIGQITISNKSGTVIREIKPLKEESQLSIDISTLQEGLYILQCHNTLGNVSHHKIIKI